MSTITPFSCAATAFGGLSNGDDGGAGAGAGDDDEDGS